MSVQIEDENYIRRYLLGELSEEEQERTEQRLLSDDDYYQQVLIVEDELIYNFVCDELPEQEKMSFRQHVLPVPERREDVKFAKALRKYVRENAPRAAEVQAVADKRASWLAPFAAFFGRPAVGFSLAVALLIALALFAWTATQNRRLRDHIAQLQTPPNPASPAQDSQEQLASERRNAELVEEQSREQERRAAAERVLEMTEASSGQTPTPRSTPTPASVTTVAGILLRPGAARDDEGEGIAKINLLRAAREIPLQLDLGADDHESYRAVLKTVGGQRELLTKTRLRAHTGEGRITVSLSLPARLLSRGDYQIRLSGATPSGGYEEVDTYYFRIDR